MASTKIKGLINLRQDRVDIWCVDLDVDGSALDELKGLLSEEENARAQRLKSKKLRKRFVISRGMLRKILSRYTGQNPKDLDFKYNQNGKPELVGSPIFFNLSHSEDLALCAVALNKAVGIDIEKVKDKIDHLGLAKEYFSEKEFRSIMESPREQRKEAFYRIWTRKEALAKAKGESILQLLDKDMDTSNWFIAELDSLGSSYVAVVAFEGKDAEIRYLSVQTFVKTISV